MGTNMLMEFDGAHPNAKNNTVVSSFIETYGISGWSHERPYVDDRRYEYIYVIPASNYSKQLVIFYYIPDDTRVNNTVIWAKLIDKDEKITQSTPGFTSGLAIASIAFLLSIVRRKRKLDTCG
jgi:hypothetical protein